MDGLSEARQAVGTLRADPPPLVNVRSQLVETAGSGKLDIDWNPETDVARALGRARRCTAQEALTNATKHAPGAAPMVQLAFTSEEVVLTVTDDGCSEGIAPSPLADTGGGYGLEGLRERSELIGGTLVAGPFGSGWQVRLSVPNDAHRSGRETT